MTIIDTFAPSRMRRARIARVVAAGAALTLVAASGAAIGATTATSTPAPCDSAQLHPDGWTRVSPPTTFTSAVVDLAVPSRQRGVIYATDGTVLSRSTDDGCSFATVYAAPAQPVTSDPQVRQQLGLRGLAFLTQLAVAPDAGNRVAALLESRFSQLNSVERQTLVATSTSGDSGSWSVLGSPLPGSPGRLVLANDSVGYVTVHPPNASTEDVFGTTDGGTTWTPGARGLDITDLTADPQLPSSVYAWGAGGLLHSIDSGKTFAAVAGISGAVTAAQVYDTPAGPELIVFARSGVGQLQLPGSVGFLPIATAGGADGADRTLGLGLGTSQPLIAYTASGLGWIQSLGGGRCPLTVASPGGSGVAHHIQSAGPGRLYLSDGSAIYRAPVELAGGCPRIPTPPVPSRPPVELTIPGVAQIHQASISPGNRTVSLRPGQRANLRFNVELPAIPTPLDVMFVVDTTGSMSPAINGLRAGIGQIVHDLASSGINVQFGLGDFQDYPIPPYGCAATPVSPTSNRCPVSDHPYRRDLPISPVGEPLQKAIESLTLGDGGDTPEAQLTGVDQTATGAGVPKVVGSPAAGYWVNPGMAAGWRPGALRVIVLATDSAFHDSVSTSAQGAQCDAASAADGCGLNAGYPGPSFIDTIAHLNSQNIKVVGLDLSGVDGSEAARDESRLAGGTTTTAPAGGVNCGDSRNLHLQAGAPLVCPVDIGDDTLKLAPAIVALLQALRDLTPLTLTASEKGQPVPVVHGHPYAAVTPTLFPAVDVKAQNVLPFTVAVACPKGPDSTHAVEIAATVRHQVLATGVVDLECQAVVKRPPPPPPPPVPPVAPLLPILVVPLIPPPAPVQPPPAQTNPQPNPNPQPGAAAEDQKEPQVAIADQVAGPDQKTALDLAMSDHRKQGLDVGTLLLWAGMASACAGAGLVLRHRQRDADRVAYDVARL